MRHWVSRREILRRLEAVEAQLEQRTPKPLAGQQTINVGTIGHHVYKGPGACKVNLFGETCGAHRDEHQLVDSESA